MNILALDLATKTGWALAEHGHIESGIETFGTAREESRGLRWVRFRRWLNGMLIGYREQKIDLVIYEQPHHRGGAATEVGIGFSTRVQEICSDLCIEYVGLHSNTLKKWTVGKGNASKVEMLEAVARRWRRVDDDNEADAIALLHYALAEIVLTEEPATDSKAAVHVRDARPART